MKAEIIAVGSELLTPDRVDTNSLFLTEELNKLGIEVLRKTIVGDNRELLAEAFRDALNRVPVVITSGGLGPTEDDLTRETVAELLGRRLQRNDEVVRAIEARFRSFKRDMPAVNLRQAMVPEGAEVLENPRGTAPGLWIEDKGRMVALLPGPPRELKPLFLEQVLPRLRRHVSGVRMFHRELRVTGLGESHVEERIRPIYTRYPHVNTTIFAHKDVPLEDVVAELLTTNRATISTAESCTGGLLAERLTRIPGSSTYFLGGVVSYSNERKTVWTEVPAELIASKGAVSAEVAVALAEGIRRSVGSTFGVGITGIAGPGGGSEEKPVGTVHIALATPTGTKERLVHLPGDREMIRFHASQLALDMVRVHYLFDGKPQPRRVNPSA